jgi:hypothetical protein
MRDKKRKEMALMEEAYQKVNENLGSGALTASVPGVSEVPLVVVMKTIHQKLIWLVETYSKLKSTQLN